MGLFSHIRKLFSGRSVVSGNTTPVFEEMDPEYLFTRYSRRVCSQCDQVKPIYDFRRTYYKDRDPNMLGYYRSYCRCCENSANKLRYQTKMEKK